MRKSQARQSAAVRRQRLGWRCELCRAQGDQAFLPMQPLDLPAAEPEQHRDANQRREAGPQARPETPDADASAHRGRRPPSDGRLRLSTCGGGTWRQICSAPCPAFEPARVAPVVAAAVLRIDRGSPDRAAIGLSAVFVRLQAKVNWHRLFEELIAGFDRAALERRQTEALSRHRGAAAGVSLNPGRRSASSANRLAANHALARLHALDGRQRKGRSLGERPLIHAEQRPRHPDLPGGDHV